MSETDDDQLTGLTNSTELLETDPITIENLQLRLEVYPQWGAKIGSMVTISGNHELLQQPLQRYAARTWTMPFEEGEASGYDECIPTVSACEIYTSADASFPSNEALSIPDHGDFWRLRFEVIEADETQVTMEATGFSIPLRLRKSITLDANRVILKYRLTNVGNAEMQYLWSAHPAFAVDAGDRIELPAVTENILVQGSRDDRLGPEGSRHSWPLTTTSSDDAVDLSLVGAAEAQIADKLFTLAAPEGWCALNRLKIGRRVEMKFEPQQAPYLGLWLCYGGWPEDKTAKQYCVALEPCTAPTDSLASAIGQGLGRRLAPKAFDEWRVELRIT